MSPWWCVKLARQQASWNLWLYSKYLTTEEDAGAGQREHQVADQRLLLVVSAPHQTAITIVKLETSRTTVFSAPSRSVEVMVRREERLADARPA